VIAPVRLWLTTEQTMGVSPSPTDVTIPLPAQWLAQLQVGETLRFRDARGASRRMQIVQSAGQGWVAEMNRTAYLATGMPLRSERLEMAAEIGPLPPLVLPLVLSPGDRLYLTRSLEPGRPAKLDQAGGILESARIGCTLPEVFADLRLGERIWFDDGKIGGVIEEVTHDHVQVQITRARAKGENLLGDKGINLPDSKLRLSALTPQDLRDLEFVAAHADMVGMSFVHTARDVEQLQQHLDQLGAQHLGIVLKIETHRAFSHLPELLLVALRSPSVGVMIARGDLAVECGYERLAELQEEILWICEAAHVPVIWATQVLEQLAKEGTPSRAEITDAAMSSRAECVMLNKGPHIRQAVAALDDILRRMEAHQTKKRALLRQLNLAHQFALAEEGL
jgi:pyruvate kinase